MKYKYSRKEFLKKVGFLFSKGKILVPNEVDGEELMKLLLAQKEDKKECKHNWKLTPDTWGETCFYCGKQRKIKTTPSPLEGFEEIEEIKFPPFDPPQDDNVSWVIKKVEEKVNLLIRNQKKLYQFIKEKL